MFRAWEELASARDQQPAWDNCHHNKLTDRVKDLNLTPLNHRRAFTPKLRTTTIIYKKDTSDPQLANNAQCTSKINSTGLILGNELA